MRHTVVRDGLVVNIVEWDGASSWQPPHGARCRRAEPDDVIGAVDRHPPAPTLEERVAVIEDRVDAVETTAAATVSEVSAMTVQAIAAGRREG